MVVIESGNVRVGKILSGGASLVGHPLQVLQGQNLLVALWEGADGKILSGRVNFVGHPLQVLQEQNLLVECRNVLMRKILSGGASLVGHPLQVCCGKLAS